MKTPQVVIKNFMAAMTNHGYSSSDSVGTQILDSAVQASSKYGGIQEVIDAMKADQIKAEQEAVEEVLGSSYAGKTISEVDSSILNADAKDYDTDNKGNAYYNTWNDSRSTVENLIKERKAYIFLEKYCGVLLADKYWINSNGSVTTWGSTTGNDDTGAITGSDANISLTAGDVVNGTTLTDADLQTLAKQDGASLSGDTLIIGTGVEKNENSVVPETGNLYTATTSTAQSISTGANDWLVVATGAGDTILTGGTDSIDAGAGNDLITVGADHASIVTGAGSDTVNISAEVTTVTLEDLNSNDALTISGPFQVGSAQLDDTILVVTDKTGTRRIRLGDFDNAKNARINGTTIANWLSNAGIDINNLESSSASVVEEPAPPVVEETGGGRIDVERKPESDTRALANTANSIQDLGGTGNAVALGNVSITGGSVTNGGNKLGDISNAFPNISTFTKRGLTINLLGVSDSTGSTSNIQTKTLDQLTDDQKKIVAGLFKWWAKECLKLNEESYGISFKSDTAMVDEIGLFLYDSQGSGNTLATVWNSHYSDGTAAALKLSVNMNYYTGISEDNVDGQSSKTSAFLDRTLSHEFTHAVMGSNVKFFSKLPQFISEGMAELTHGIDDERGIRIYDLAYDASKLTKALDLTNTSTGTADAYAGGYMFLRYFAKQAALQTILDAPSKVITLTEGDDTYQNTVEGATIQALGGNDSITNYSDNVSINAGTGNDSIYNEGSFVTITGGDGDDSIKHVLGQNSLIEGGEGNDQIFTGGRYVTISGGNGDDSIFNGNFSSNVMIDAGDGNDSVHNHGSSLVMIDGGTGDDSIDNWGDSITVLGGDGKDLIQNGFFDEYYQIYYGGNNSTIDGGASDDSITNSGASVSIDGGADDDSITNTGDSVLFLYTSGDGNDVIDGFRADSTLQIGDGTGTYSTLASDNDLIVTVGEGKITLVGAASLNTLNILGTLEDGNVAGVSINNTLDATLITGTAYDDSITNSGKNVTIQALGGNDSIRNEYSSSVTIDTGAGDDTIYNDNGDYVSINGGAGNDSINNSECPDYLTINAGDGNDTLAGNAFNSFVDMGAGNDFVSMMGAGGYGSTFEGGAGDDTIYTSILGSVSGGDGNDLINVETYTFTLNGGKGDDTINVDPRYFGVSTRTYEYKPGDGNDVIIGFSKKDSLLIAGGEYSTAVSGNDIIVTVGEGKITLKDAKGIEPIIRDFVNPQDTIGISIFNSTSDTIINGSAGYDSIVNFRAKDVTINAGAGNDTIENRNYSEASHLLINAGDGDDNISNDGEYATINAGDGDDYVYNGGYGDSSGEHGAHHSVIDLGNGDDDISNYENYTTIYGGAGNDNILNNGEYTTIDVGDGNDTILNSGANVLFLYNVGNGNDVITGLNATSTLQIGDGTGTYSKTTLDNGDVEVTVGDGKVTLVGAASLDTLNIFGEEISVEPEWRLNGTTATYGTAGNTLITVSGVKSLDGISLDDKVVTISAASLGTSKVTISDGYTLALGKDAAVPKTVAASYNANTMTYTSAGKTAGYTLANNAISYSSSTSLEFKFSGIADTATAKGFFVNGKTNTIAIGAVSVNPDKTIPVKLLSAPEGYKMELGSSLPKPTTISANTYDAKTMTYKTKGTTGSYTLSGDGKTISYTPGTSLEFLFSGISDTATSKGFFVNDSKKTIAIGAVSVNPDKTIPVKLLSAPDGYKMELGTSLPKPATISANTYDAKTMTYKTKGTTGSYTLSSDGKTISYTPGTSKEFAFSGIADSATTKGFYVNVKTNTIAIGAVSVKTDGTPVKLLSAPAGYKMELGASLPKPGPLSANTYDAKTMTYKTKGTTGSYTLSSDGKTISYTAGTSKEFTFSGISDTATAKGFFVNDSKKTIAIGAVSVKTDGTPVKLLSAPDGYKMELGSSLSKAATVGTSTLEDGFYTAESQTAGYTISHGGKAIKYREALDTAFELDGVAAKPTTPTNGVVTLKLANFDKRLSVMSNDAEYAFSIAKDTYTGKTFTGSADADTITSAGSGLIINAGKGNDSIENSGASVKINGGLGNDYVKNSGWNVTINGGTGNDTLWGGSYADTFVYKSGDGKDVIGGFDDNDLLQITGTFTTAYDSAAGTVKFTVGTGSITLTDFTATTFNVNGDSYVISGKTLVKK